jgi:hypothetical protein
LARDFQNPCTACSYCNSFDHVIEDCTVLLEKLQERQGGNQQVQLISVEPRGEDPRVTVITRGGTVTGEDKVTPGNTIDGSGIRKYVERTQLVDPRKEKQTFEEERREFVGEQTSSREQPEVRECGMPPTFDQSSLDRQGKEVSKLMDFLYTCINLIKDEKVVQEIQHLLKQ